MNHLIICAHPSPKSFSCQLSHRLLEEGKSLGWQVTLRDLYNINFKAVLDASDLEQLKKGDVPNDIQQEQELIQQADIITIISPLWWAGFPAILKGYIDRVLAYGFAFEIKNGEARGLLQGRKVVLVTSMGNKQEHYDSRGLIDAFNTIRDSEVFGFCGMEVIHQTYFEEVPTADDRILEQYSQQALTIYENILHAN
jgi:NAD(P)H dehydrogenase (quinone)